LPKFKGASRNRTAARPTEAFIFHGGKIVSKGVSNPFRGREMNCSRNHQNTGMALSRHAEQMALSRLSHKKGIPTRGKYKMIILRRLEDGSLGNSMPCTVCLRRSIEFGISKIGYIDNRGQCVITTPQSLIGKTKYTSAENRLRHLEGAKQGEW
jgi:deoxycytidylate deaminase